MAITEARKLDLGKAYGDQSGCLLGDSWLRASKDDLLGNTRMYSTDIDFMLNTPAWCPPSVTPTVTTGVLITTTGEVGASIYVDGLYKGKTETTIAMEPGNYLAKLTRSGYDSLEVPLIVVSGQIFKPIVTMTSTSSTPTTGTPIIVYTGNKTEPPYGVQIGKENWFGYEHRNEGDANWRGYLGVKITDSAGHVFTYEGNPAYATIVKPGETKMLWASCTVTGLVKGQMTIVMLRTTLS